MAKIANLFTTRSNSRYFGPAVISGTQHDQCSTHMNVQVPGYPTGLKARIAVPLEDVLSPGDQVLVALENENQIYIIGVLNQKVVNKKRPVKFEIENGAFAKIEGSKGKANIQIFSNQKDLIFEYSPSSGKAKVISNSSSICVEAPGGDLSLNCKGNLNLGAEQVNISGHSALNLTTAGLENFKGSSIGIKNNQLKISSPDIRTTAELGHFNIKETRYTGKNLLSKIGQLKIVADKMETTANSVVDKIKDIFKTVENLYQLKAKRKRMVVETTYHVKAEDITFKSEEDFKVKGNQIHLG